MKTNYLLFSCLLMCAQLCAQTMLECDPGTAFQNTDVPVEFVTSPLDVSSCSSINFSFDYSYSQPYQDGGGMESCDYCNGNPFNIGCDCDPYADGCEGGGTNCGWDFLLVDAMVDDRIYQHFLSGTVTNDPSQGSTIFSGDYACADNAVSAQFLVRAQTTAMDEIISISNLCIVCWEKPEIKIEILDCAGEENNAMVSLVDPENVVTPNTLLWTLEDPADDVNISTQIESTSFVDYVENGQSISLHYTDPSGCIVTISQTIIFPEDPNCDCILNLDEIADETNCGPYTLLSPTQNGQTLDEDIYDIVVSDGISSYELGHVLTLEDQYNLTVEVSKTGDQGCRDTETFVLDILETPVLPLIPAQGDICKDFVIPDIDDFLNVNEFTEAYADAGFYDGWQMEEGKLLSEGSMAPENVYLFVSDGNCSSEAEIEIIRAQKDLDECDKDEIWMPNIFTPEGSVNNTISVFGSEDYTLLELIIHDRWGNEVFSKKNPILNNLADGWDGRIQQERADPAVYMAAVTFLNLRGIEQMKVFSITLSR